MTTLFIQTDLGNQPVEMPSVTSIRYAAMRVAEVLGYDPTGADWRLVDPLTREPITEDELVAAHAGELFLLAVMQQQGESG